MPLGAACKSMVALGEEAAMEDGACVGTVCSIISSVGSVVKEMASS